MIPRFRFALLIALSIVAAACGKGRGGAAGDSCEAVGEHYLKVAKAEVAKTEGEDKKNAEAMLSLLPKLKTQLVTECTRDKWSVEARKCMLAANSAAAAKACAELTGKSAPAAPPAAAEPVPSPEPAAPAAAKPSDAPAPTPSPNPADDGAQ